MEDFQAERKIGNSYNPEYVAWLERKIERLEKRMQPKIQSVDERGRPTVISLADHWIGVSRVDSEGHLDIDRCRRVRFEVVKPVDHIEIEFDLGR